MSKINLALMLPFSFSKKSLFSLIGILLAFTTLIVLIALVVTALTKKSAQANASLFTVDLPEPNYQDLAPNQQKSLLDQLGQQFPVDQDISIVTHITFVQEDQPLPADQPPLGGDGQLPPFTPPSQTDLVWPTFHFSWVSPGPGQAQAAEQEANKIKSLVEKYYPLAVELFSLPYKADSRPIAFLYAPNSNFFGFLPQFNTVVLHSSSPYEVIPGLLSAFYGQYFPLLPETWRYGLVYTAAELAINRFPEDIDQTTAGFMESWRSRYEKYNVTNFPIWGTSLHYPQDLVLFSKKERLALATAAFLKPYQYDSQIFAKLNQKIYSLDPTASFWSDDLQLGKELESVWPTIEGLSAGDWYGQQHVLHQTQTNPLAILAMRLFGQLLIVAPVTVPEVHSFKSHLTDNGIIFIPKENKSYTIKVFDDLGQLIGEPTVTTNRHGHAQVDSVPDAGFTNPGRYHFESQSTQAETFYTLASPVGFSLFGAVLNFGSGTIEAYQGGNLITSALITHGGFVFTQPMSGVLQLKVKDYQGNLVLEKELAKFPGRYYALLDSPVKSYPPASASPPPIGGGECGQDLPHLFSSTAHNFSIRYPDGFEVLDSSQATGPNIDNSQDIISEGVVQFLNQTSGADNLIGGSMITVIWHRNPNDLAVDDFARSYFSSETGQVRMWETCGKEFAEFTFKTMSEPFANPMAAPTEVELQTYFVADGSQIYILSSSRDDLAKNSLLKMLESIDFGSGSANFLIPCSQDLLNTAQGLIDQQEDWWDKPEVCADVPDNPVCGHIHSLYEGGQESDSAQTYRNACTYCKIFDETGYRGLRGTKMYSLGYQKGACQ